MPDAPTQPPDSEQIADSRDDRSPEDERVASLMEHTIDVPIFAEAVEQQRPADAADTLEDLETEAVEVLQQMEDQSAAEALAEMETPLAISVLDDLVQEDRGVYARTLLELMAPDDAADLLQAISERDREHLLRRLKPESAARLRRLVSYPEDSAGGLMTTDFLALRTNLTVGQAIEMVRDVVETARFPQGMQHLMVMDDDDRLAGVISLRDLLLSPNRSRVADVMNPDVASVPVDLDQEEVAQKFDRYDYYMLAVVDDDNHLLGIVTVDDVIDIIRAEQTEDVQRTVGAGAGEAVYSSMGEKFKGRFPWLLVNLFTTGIAAIVVLQFEGLIAELAILAVLMPIIAAQAGNAGHQSLAVTLRGIVLDEVRRDRVSPLIWREAAVGFLSGALLGIIVGGFMALLDVTGWVAGASWELGAVVAFAMALSTGVGTLAGASIPLIMRKVGADPAMASAIFLIMVTDAVAFATFLGAAQAVATWLGIGGA